jgi:hypothetical protein
MRGLFRSRSEKASRARSLSRSPAEKSCRDRCQDHRAATLFFAHAGRRPVEVVNLVQTRVRQRRNLATVGPPPQSDRGFNSTI